MAQAHALLRLGVVIVSKRLGSREIDVVVVVFSGGGLALRLHRNDSVGGGGAVMVRRFHFGIDGDEVEVDFREGVVTSGVEIGAFRVGRSRKEPGSGFGFISGDVSISMVRVREVRAVVVDGGVVVVEGGDRDAFMAAGEGVGGVDVVVAGEAEDRSVGLAGDVSGGLLADFAEGDARVAGGELVGGVDFGVAGETEEGRVRAAEQGGCR